MIPYGMQEITEEDIDSVLAVLRSDFLTQGPQVPKFEKAITDFTGSKFSLAVNSATSALHIACLALDLGPKDLLWTTPVSFVASANCGRYCGASLDFVDIDPKTYNLCPVKLKEKLSIAESAGKLPKILVVVHLCGQPCDMKPIHDLSIKYGFKIIEDASHAIGGRYDGKPIGACEYSNITVFSFHPVKIITTGEGGAAVTNDQELADRMKLYRSHGITRDISQMRNEPHGDWYYEQIALGFNYRMTDLQAALGVSQMQRLAEVVESRHDLAKRYDEKLRHLPLNLPQQLENTYSGLHLYVIRLILPRLSKTHKEIFTELRSKGIGVNLHYIPIHTQPYYRDLGFNWGDFPEAENYYREAISIPMFHAMTPDLQDEVVAVLNEVLV
jgi:UDP-4-amino-4,6-dideoxy-N-acetyl-beta-L-altrosamine transaminase